jgi:endonuclease/exonuclease/phosphatase family metal-dependent hydrolase
MKILSFNVSWECMSNSEEGTAGKLGSICKNLSHNNFQCRDNLILYLQQIRNIYDDFDIICLQEAANLDVLKNEFNQNFFFHHHKSGPEVMITIINNYKYKITDILTGEFKKGRPYCIFILESILDASTLIVVNLHYCSNYNHEVCNDIKFYLTQTLLNKYPNYQYQFCNSRIVVAGDFNYHSNPNLIQENNNILSLIPFEGLLKLNSIKPFKSCCYQTEFNQKIDFVTDLIFDSHSINQIQILKPKIPISDHLPIISFLP